jgi:hypothetical protein
MPRLRLTEKQERTNASPTAAGDDGAASEHAGLAKELLKVLAWQVSRLQHRTVCKNFLFRAVASFSADLESHGYARV